MLYAGDFCVIAHRSVQRTIDWAVFGVDGLISIETRFFCMLYSAPLE